MGSRRLVVLLCALGALFVSAAPAAPADPTGLIQLSISGPDNILAGEAAEYVGSLTVAGVVGLPGQTVELLVDGAPVATGPTDTAGGYELGATFGAPGTFAVRAAAFRGTLLETLSPTITLTVTAEADLALSQMLPPGAIVGEEILISWVIANNGPSAATDVHLQGDLSGLGGAFMVVSVTPEQGACMPGSVVHCSLGSLASAASTLVRVRVHLFGEGTMTSQADVEATQPDPQPMNNLVNGSFPVTTPAPVAVVINEVDYDQPSTDTREFVELFGAPGQSLDGLALVFVNGATSAEYMRVDLTGRTLGSTGYLVIGNMAVPPAPGTMPIIIPDNTVQNGAPDGVVLFHVPTNTVVDALSYEGSIPMALITGAPGAYNLVEGNATPVIDPTDVEGSLSRLPNGADSNDAATDWALGEPTPGDPNI